MARSGICRFGLRSAKLASVFERFTERARQAVVRAQDEARLLGHDSIETEHLLLGLLGDRDAVAAQVLANLGLTIEEVRAQVTRAVGEGRKAPEGQPIPFASRSKGVLELSLREALALGHDSIGTEHILLGLVRVTDGLGAAILLDFGIDAEKVHEEVARALSGLGGRADTVTSLQVTCPNCATPVDAISTVHPTTSDLSAESDRTCPGCGKLWTISFSVGWQERGE
jgi:ATP-dependent Clp protease ATP-binding subunit ClpA